MTDKNKKGILKPVLYVVSAVLICFYLLVMWWGLNPNVGTEYKMYYITHELSDWPGYGKLSYSLGTMEYCTGYKTRDGKDVDYIPCMRKGTGWSRYNYDGSTSEATDSFIYYIPDETFNGAGDVEYCFQITEYKGLGSTRVYIGDKKIGSFNAKGYYYFKAGELKPDELVKVRFESGENTFVIWKAYFQGK